MLSLFERLACLLQQAGRHGVLIVHTEPLEVQGPSRAVDHFAAIIHRFREEAASLGDPLLVDRSLRSLCDLKGGIRWDQIYPDSPEDWLLTPYEENLLSLGLEGPAWIDGADVRAGRLEGVAPGRCFLTPTPYIVASDGVCSPAQLGVVSFPSWQVRLKPTDVHQESDSNDGGLAL